MADQSMYGTQLSEQEQQQQNALIAQIIKQAQTSHAPPEISPEQRANALRQDTAAAKTQAGERFNAQAWRGGGLLGLGITPLLNMVGKKDKMERYNEEALTGLTGARSAAEASKRRGAMSTANIEANKAIESMLTQSRKQQFETGTNKANQAFEVGQAEIARGQELEDAAGETILEDSRLRDERAREDQMREIKQFHDPNDPTGKTALNLWEYNNQFTRMDGTPIDPQELAKLKVWTDPDSGSVANPSAANKKFDKLTVEQDGHVTGMLNTFSTIMNSPKDEFKSATGPADYERYGAQFMGEDNPYYERVGDLQRSMKSMNFDAMAPALQVLLGSTSDKEMLKAANTAPSMDSEPLAWATWSEDQYIPTLISRARAVGLRPEEEIAAIETRMRADVAKFRETHKRQDPKTLRRQQELEMEELDKQIKAAGG